MKINSQRGHHVLTVRPAQPVGDGRPEGSQTAECVRQRAFQHAVADGRVEPAEDPGAFLAGLSRKVGETVGEGCLFVGEGGEAREGAGTGAVGLGG